MELIIALLISLGVISTPAEYNSQLQDLYPTEQSIVEDMDQM